VRSDRLPTAAMVARRRAEALVERLRERHAQGPFPEEDRVVGRLVAEGREPAAAAAPEATGPGASGRSAAWVADAAHRDPKAA